MDQQLTRDGFPIDRFGDVLLRVRERKGMTQSKLAQLANIDHSYVSRLEGNAREPSSDMVHVLARAMEADPREGDELHLAAGSLPPGMSRFPELVDLLLWLQDPGTPDDKRQAVRRMLWGIVELAQAERRGKGARPVGSMVAFRGVRTGST